MHDLFSGALLALFFYGAGAPLWKGFPGIRGLLAVLGLQTDRLVFEEGVVAAWGREWLVVVIIYMLPNSGGENSCQ